AQHAKSVADVLGQLFKPDPRPDFPRLFLDARDVSKLAQSFGARRLRRHAERDVVAGLTLNMVTDIFVQVVERVPPACHGQASSGLKMRAMARASLSHLLVSIWSCLRPLAVSR